MGVNHNHKHGNPNVFLMKPSIFGRTQKIRRTIDQDDGFKVNSQDEGRLISSVSLICKLENVTFTYIVKFVHQFFLGAIRQHTFCFFPKHFELKLVLAFDDLEDYANFGSIIGWHSCCASFS